MCWRRPRSPRIGNPLNSFQQPENSGNTGAPYVRYSVRWMNGFAERDNALPVSEQDFSVSVSRKPKISQTMSYGRLGSPLSYVIIGREGRSAAGLGSLRSSSLRSILDHRSLLESSVPNERVHL